VSIEISGRSYERQIEDEILEAHASLSEALILTSNGRVLYVNRQRDRIKQWKERCERAILNGDTSEVTKFVPPHLLPGCYIRYLCL